MLLVLVKHSLIVTSDSHFAGGKHAFVCMAKTLAETGHAVHVVHVSDKASVMVFCLKHGLLGKISYDSRGQHIVQFDADGVCHHVVLQDVVTEMALKAGVPVHQALTEVLVSRCESLTGSTGHFRVIVDADDSQQSQAGVGDGGCMFAVLAEKFGPQMVALIQNVHFLPFGPSGTSFRTPRLLAAWQRIGGVLCVSCFVQEYVAEHAKQVGLQVPHSLVTPLAAWGVFGDGPFPDFGSEAHARLTSTHTQIPLVGILKLTPEKGAAIFFNLARRLPELRFLAVSGDPSVQEFARDFVNMRVIPPQADVDSVLSTVCVLLVPSIWQEAFGMVVVDAMLRGIPAIVSDLGGLPEAGLGQAQLVPVYPIHIPINPQHGGHPDWSQRIYPPQTLDPWLEAIHALLSDPAMYKRRSQASRNAATAYVEGRQVHVQQCTEWLAHQLQDAPASAGCVDSLTSEMSRQSL